MSIEKLNILRNDMKVVTNQILNLINQRMIIAKDIGAIKTKLNIEIIDDNVEQDIKNYLLQNSNHLDLNSEFSGRIVNLLINESIRIQNLERIKSNKEHEAALGDVDMKNLKIDNIKDTDQHKKEKHKIKTHLDVFNAAKNLESDGKNIIHLEVGEPDLLPPEEVNDGLRRIYESGRFHYTQSAGIKELRDGLSKYIYELSNRRGNNPMDLVNPNNIIVTPGGRFAIFCVFSALLKPGDEIIVIEPAWPACYDCACYLGVKTRIVKTEIEGNWEPDISEIEKYLNINTKIICLNYPNNPTGKILSKKTLESIIDLAIRKNIFILSDEVYCNYSYMKFHSITSFPYDKSILIGSFSKTFAMTGFRVGFAYATDKNLIDKITQIQALSLTSVAEPMQYCAIQALRSDPESYTRTMRKRIEIACSILEDMPLTFTYPDGAMYIFAKIDRSLNLNDLKLVEKLLENGVAVAPGSGFGNSYSDFIRISACINEEKLLEGLGIMEKLFREL